MKTIEYSPDGVPIPDAKARDSARVFLLGSIDRIHVSSETFVTAVRLLIAEEVIPHDEVQFFFEDHTLRPGRYGELDRWPRGFCDHSTEMLIRLLEVRCKVKK